MADIEERCEKYLKEVLETADLGEHPLATLDLMRKAYMAGVAQTQQDYSRYYANG
jgi:hypothetical protein